MFLDSLGDFTLSQRGFVPFSGDQILNHMPVYIGKAAIDTVMAVGEFFMVNAQEVEDGGVYIVNLCGMISVEGFIAPFIAFAAGDSSSNTATTEPVCEDKGIVIASLGSLSAWHAPKFGGPKYNRFV